jgi:hypothetical protein
MRLGAHGGTFAISLVLASSFILAVMVALSALTPR